jgi:hypothetical protein
MKSDMIMVMSFLRFFSKKSSASSPQAPTAGASAAPAGTPGTAGGAPSDAAAPPLAPLGTIHVRTMASDIQSIQEGGGGPPHSYTPAPSP